MASTTNNVIGTNQVTTYYPTFTKEDQDFTVLISAVNNESTENLTQISASIDMAELRLNNKWNDSIITEFNIFVNGLNYTINDGIFYSTLNGTYLTQITANDYITRNVSINYTNNNTNYENLWETELTINANEISTGNGISNWSINTSNGMFNTTTNDLTIYPNIGIYSWDWFNDLTYFNQSDLTFNVTGKIQTLTISNLYARNISIENALAVGQVLTPNCTQGSYSYLSYPYYMPLDTQNMTCQLTGYQDTTFTMNSTPDESVYEMIPAMLHLIFSELTEGYIETANCNDAPNNCDWFNATAIYTEQYNISEGKVVVKFNPDGSGNWNQIFEYNNDQDTHMKEYLQIITPDLVQSVKVTGNKVPLEDARVTAKTTGTNPDTNNTDWITVYSDFTNVDGESELLINDEDTYKFCAQADGFTTKCIIQYIPPASTTTIQIDMDPTTIDTGFNFIASSCSNIFTEDENCTLEINTFKTYNTISINFTEDGVSTIYTSSDSVSKIFNYDISNSTGNVSISVYLDGELVEELGNYYMEYDPDNLINWESKTDNDGYTLYERVKSEKEYLIATYIILTIIGVIMGFMAEKYFNGYGPYGTMIWFMIMALSKFYIFWIPVVVIAVYGIVEKLMPLLQNK